MKSKDTAVTSLILGFLVWLPLLNFVIGPLATYFGILALVRIKKNPDQFTGTGYAVFGLILGVFATLFSYVWLINCGIGNPLNLTTCAASFFN